MNKNDQPNEENSFGPAVLLALALGLCCLVPAVFVSIASLGLSALLAKHGYTFLAGALAILTLAGFWYYRHRKRNDHCDVPSEDH